MGCHADEDEPNPEDDARLAAQRARDAPALFLDPADLLPSAQQPAAAAAAIAAETQEDEDMGSFPFLNKRSTNGFFKKRRNRSPASAFQRRYRAGRNAPRRRFTFFGRDSKTHITTQRPPPPRRRRRPMTNQRPRQRQRQRRGSAGTPRGPRPTTAASARAASTIRRRPLSRPLTSPPPAATPSAANTALRRLTTSTSPCASAGPSPICSRPTASAWPTTRFRCAPSALSAA